MPALGTMPVQNHCEYVSPIFLPYLYPIVFPRLSQAVAGWGSPWFNTSSEESGVAQEPLYPRVTRTGSVPDSRVAIRQLTLKTMPPGGRKWYHGPKTRSAFSHRSGGTAGAFPGNLDTHHVGEVGENANRAGPKVDWVIISMCVCGLIAAVRGDFIFYLKQEHLMLEDGIDKIGRS
ncbi:hypothetical protein C8R44DRAFT_724471 [Mycena epipterygia]|nr:hypothetical protein C8R44DRAFT_724471 [Mycena epipterygia]